MQENADRTVHFTSKVYQLMLNYLTDTHFQNQCGQAIDLNFLEQDDWLRDTAVNEHLVLRSGTWDIHLVFAHYQKPLTFRRRLITSQNNVNKAQLMANYMRRLAAKDQRGTLKVSLADLDIAVN